ncbi:MAG: hypothetical protein A3H61_02890 [Candidatus Jacksonbacteria bacterium RIFCSPLOWO2_02_FULL_44_20]|uniref:AAA+ ATPase domain-containing protein n=1 Tax=Candidatus Jacksonbacteria bacterium RIFCSPLOWO2_02_FULL_44_20 TaxID=1798460 RepID=A0A1G2A8B0_9BACT|nr:MAG: hypothetical protein A3H07_02910 [Candidatus Jacksonbacteria bacterium RIFCSPLOWO2_12_FULL_44_15b]OGY73128.1 MAG: hypothetical protein A3H61_02890 [Candidatus Jacksonbacteria bacterium RIFCSPLOWO2_02_FULL_44_20]HCA66796.1 hypothetical protein [Candidatus Jacksonbacteria bacterium]HCE86349.1 hypothetical protein [Candidatus Jacksonbacteria bacterium]
MVTVDILAQFNPWWTQKEVPKVFVGSHERPILRELIKHLDSRFAVLLFGLRRVGKTTTFYQLIKHLLRIGSDERKVLYFSFDDQSATIQNIVALYEEKIIKKKLGDIDRIFFFFDEIQKVADWQSAIKQLYDLHPNVKIFLSGSASVTLEKNARESLAGRMIDIYAAPLTFKEFLDWKNNKVALDNPELAQGEIQPLLMDYLRKGGFPELAHEESDDAVRQYLKNLILERIIYRDLPQEFALKDAELLRTLLEYIVREPGNIVNVERLARDTGRSKITIGNYLGYLQYGLLVRAIGNLRPGFLIASRKGKKYYPVSPAFCFAYRSDFYTDALLAKVAESAVAMKLNAEYYYRNGFEIDFVRKDGQEILPIEVKWGKPDEVQLKAFMEKFSISSGILVTRDVFRDERSGIRLVPLWKFLLED